METIIIASLVVISMLFVGIHHLANWVFRKLAKEGDSLIGLLFVSAIFYCGLITAYYFYFVETLKLLVK